jgi:hypothetical protein
MTTKPKKEKGKKKRSFYEVEGKGGPVKRK